VAFFSLKDCRDNDEHEVINKWLEYYDESEKLLNHFIEEWLETKGLHYTEFDKSARSEIRPVAFFILWAINKDLTKDIPWWSEAVETGLIHSEADNLSRQDNGDVQFSDLLPFTDLVKQIEPYGKTEHDIFSLAVKGELVIYAPIEAVTVLWYIAIGTDYRDPKGEIEYEKSAFLPLTRECVQTMAISNGKVKLDFDYPSALRSSELDTKDNFPLAFRLSELTLTAEEKYISELRPLGWLHFDKHEWSKDKNVKEFSEGNQTKLYIRVEDKDRLEKALLSTQGSPVRTDQKIANGSLSEQVYEQNHRYENYIMRADKKHWNIRFNSGKKYTIDDSKPIRSLLEYLRNPGNKMDRAEVYNRLHVFQPEPAKIDADQEGLQISRANDLQKDPTKTLTQKEVDYFNEYLASSNSNIERLILQGETEEADKEGDKVKNMISRLKKDYNAKFDPEGSKIIDWNKVQKEKDRAAENIKKHLDRAVEELKCVPGLFEHLTECLIKNKDIYLPPENFSEWKISD
jgi:hypothetical protein